MLHLDTPSAWLCVAIVAVATFLVVIVAPAGVASPAGPGCADMARQSPSRTGDCAAQAASRLLGGMSLDEKVGQLFVTYAYGDRVDTDNPADVANNRAAYGVDNAAALIEKYHLGGIIYFGRFNNVNNPRQIAQLSNGIQRRSIRSSESGRSPRTPSWSRG